MPDKHTVVVALANGDQIRVRAELADQVRGIDPDGDLVVSVSGGTDDLIPLTPCCQASGKGCGSSDTGVVCRTCYQDVDIKYGGHATIAVALADTR